MAKRMTVDEFSQFGSYLFADIDRPANSEEAQILLGDRTVRQRLQVVGAEIIGPALGAIRSSTPPSPAVVQPKPINPYESEHGKLTSSYPPGWEPAGLADQRDRLLQALPNLKLPDPVCDGSVPEGFDAFGYQVFPERLGRRYGIEAGDDANYGRVIEEVVWPAVKKVYASNGLAANNYLAGELTKEYVRLNEDGRILLAERQAATEYDAFIAPISYGHRWLPLTCSPRNALETTRRNNELALGFVQGGCHLIAQPERMTHLDHLRVDCSGDQYDSYLKSVWAHSLSCYVSLFSNRVPNRVPRDEVLRLDCREADFLSGYYASFVLQLGA